MKSDPAGKRGVPNPRILTDLVKVAVSMFQGRPTRTRKKEPGSSGRVTGTITSHHITSLPVPVPVPGVALPMLVHGSARLGGDWIW